MNDSSKISPTRATSLLLLLAGVKLAIHLIANAFGGYGFFRDEFYYAACGQHLAFGYVDHAPLCALIMAVSRAALGDSLFAIRFLPAVAGAVVVYCAGLVARELGGGKWGQVIAAIATISSPVLFGIHGFFSMNAFDQLFWIIALLLVLRILNGGSTRLWVWLGIDLGIGLMNKHSVAFLIAGLVLGFLVTRERKRLLEPGFRFAALIAALIFLPNVLWQITNGFPTLEWSRNAVILKNIPLSPLSFFLTLIPDMNMFALPLFLAGLYFFLAAGEGGRYRPLGWTVVCIFILFVLARGKPYYFAPLYPLMFAGGAVWIEARVTGTGWDWVQRHALPQMLIISGICSLPFAIPVLPVETFIRYQAMIGMAPRNDERQQVGKLSQHYADMFGWEEMTKAVADVYHALPDSDKQHCAIYAQNYGEAGAMEFFGRAYQLPRVISGHNNYWLWGPGDFKGNVLIILGGKKEDHSKSFESVEQVGETDNVYAMPYERHLKIYIARRIRVPLQAAWARCKMYI